MEGEPSTQLRWLPNAITCLRLAALPILAWMIVVDDGPTSARAAWFFAAIGATDWIDGYLARRLKAVSKFGSVADPFADRMLMAVGLIGLIELGRYGWPGPTIILARDVAAIVAFVVLARRGVELKVDVAGKISSGMAMFAVGLAMLIDHVSIDVYFWIAVGVSVGTFLNYARVIANRLRISG